LDTRKHSLDTDSLLPMLALYSTQRDQALGLPRAGRRTLSLVDYRRKQERRVTIELASAAFLKGVIDECRAEVGRLIKGADTPDKRREILPEVERLQTMAETAGTQLEAMNG